MNSPEKSNKQLVVLMIVSMIMWGISWPSNKVLTQFGSANDLGVFRYALVVLSLLPLLLFLKVPLKVAKKGIPFIVISGVLMASYNFTFLQGLKNGSPGKGGILVTTLNPVMAYALGMLIDWKRPARNETIGLSLGILAGLVLLEVWAGGASLLEPGNLYFLLAAFLWSVMSKFTSRSSLYGSPFAFTWWMYLVTLLTLLPLMDAGNVAGMIQLRDIRFWGNLFFSSVIVTTFATTMYFFATARIGAERASSFIFTVPFTAALCAWLILGEVIEPHTIVGGLLGIGAVWMINLKQKKQGV